MKFKITKKIAIEIGALIVIGLIVVFMANVNTNLFKGSISDVDECETATTAYEQLHANVTSSLETIEALNVENATLAGYTDRETELDAISTYLDENPSFDCAVDMEAVTAQLNEYQATSLPGIQSAINAELEAVPACPLDSEDHAEYEKFTDFVEAHNGIEAGLGILNAKQVWDEDDFDLMKDLVKIMRILDISDLSGEVSDEEEAEIDANLIDTDINFANITITAYNEEIITGAIQDLECEGIDVLPLISPPTECGEGAEFSESSNTCVAVEAGADQCEYNDLFTDMDSIYEILEDAEDDPSDFEDDESATVATLLSQFPSEYRDGFSDYISEIDYEEDANDIIDEINLIILLLNDDECEKEMFDGLNIEGEDESDDEDDEDESDDEEGDDEENMCPEGATYSKINDIDICTCDNDASIVESDGSCEDTGDTAEEIVEEEDDISLFICLDGLTEVINPFDCPEFNNNPPIAQADPETDDFFGAADNEGSNIDLTTNTDPNIMSTPEVQGDTGPGIMTSFLLFLSVLGGGLLRSLSII